MAANRFSSLNRSRCHFRNCFLASDSIGARVAVEGGRRDEMALEDFPDAQSDGGRVGVRAESYRFERSLAATALYLVSAAARLVVAPRSESLSVADAAWNERHYGDTGRTGCTGTPVIHRVARTKGRAECAVAKSCRRCCGT